MNFKDPPLVVRVDGITLVDDSVIGTKARISRGIAQHSLKHEFFYATTPDGASALAVAEAGRDFSKKVTLITTQPQDDRVSLNLQKARDAGASITVIPTDDINIVARVAKNLAETFKGEFVDFESDLAINIIAETAKTLNLDPGQVWSASARGAMARAYQKAWPTAEHFAIVVLEGVEGADFGTATQYPVDEPYTLSSGETVPFPCNRFYEGRAWPVAVKHADLGKSPLFWNPAAP